MIIVSTDGVVTKWICLIAAFSGHKKWHKLVMVVSSENENGKCVWCPDGWAYAFWF